MIDFFGLDRDGLVANRAWWLLNAVWPNVEKADTGHPGALEDREWFCSERAQFTSCAKCFVALCAADRPAAEVKVAECRQILKMYE